MLMRRDSVLCVCVYIYILEKDAYIYIFTNNIILACGRNKKVLRWNCWISRPSEHSARPPCTALRTVNTAAVATIAVAVVSSLRVVTTLSLFSSAPLAFRSPAHGEVVC